MIKYLIELKKYVKFSYNKGIPHHFYYIIIHDCIVPYTLKTFIKNLVFAFMRQQRGGNYRKP
jgi:hypothetical protein